MGRGSILVYDDEEDIKSECQEDIESVPVVMSQYKVDPLETSKFAAEVHELINRQSAARNGGLKDPGDNLAIDKADVLIIDYDLPAPGLRDGEEIAYYVSCFSNCTTVMVLNALGRDVFDLKMTQTSHSFADYNANSSDLKNPGLWSGEKEEYRQWSWPPLLDSIQSARKRRESFDGDFDIPLRGLLGFPDEAWLSMSRTAGEKIGSTREELMDFTLQNFYDESPFVKKPKDRDMRLPQGLKEQLVHARLASWLERFVLLGQDVLVDAPHLACRYPSLLSGDVGKKEDWDATATLGRGSTPAINLDVIQDSEFGSKDWLSRRAWFWDSMSRNREILEIKTPWERESSKFVFAEDTSNFIPETDAHMYISELETDFYRRYIKRFDHVTYSPLNRLLSGD